MEQNLERPAFPSYHGLSWKDGRLGEFHGMTLRDYFAAKAMQQFAGQRDFNILAHDRFIANVEEMTRCAYLIADAMLKAREQ